NLLKIILLPHSYWKKIRFYRWNGLSNLLRHLYREQLLFPIPLPARQSCHFHQFDVREDGQAARSWYFVLPKGNVLCYLFPAFLQLNAIDHIYKLSRFYYDNSPKVLQTYW